MGHALILDDAQEWVEKYIALLKETPYENHTISGDLEDALRNARQNEYGLYVCDCDFPHKEGGIIKKGAFFLFYEELIKIHPNPNLVMLSNGVSNVQRAMRMGIDAFLKEKNLDEGKLVARLKVAP
jgi:DNA-binding NarL/FixJ family response regulator